MPTFADGESGASVRTKINDAITAVEGMIESGSNSNGYYVRYSDGTQICWQNFNENNLAVTGVGGSLYRSATFTAPDFPVTFSATPTVVIRGNLATSSSAWLAHSGVPTTTKPTGGDIRAWSVFSVTQTFRWSYIAVGSWS